MESIRKSIGFGLAVSASHFSRTRLQRLTGLKVNINNVPQSASPSFQVHTRHFSSVNKLSSNANLKLTNKPFGLTQCRKKTDAQLSLAEVLDREIEDEQAELGQHLSTEQFPGFSVETDGSQVKLTKQIDNKTVTVRFSVSSSLNDWPLPQEQAEKTHQDDSENCNSELLSMPDFQVQVSKDNTTLEFSCYFDNPDDGLGEVSLYEEPAFNIDEIVVYENEPKESEFVVNAEYFQQELQESMIKYLEDHGIDEEFGKNLVQFATSYEKKQYIGLMKRLKKFISS